MILREVVLHNFGPYKGRAVIDLSPRSESKRRPVVLIGALNGSGKTTLLDAIQLALYGSRARCSSRKGVSYTDFLRQSINVRAVPAEGASVSVEFDYATSRGTSRLRVARNWRVTAKGVVEESRVFRDEREDAELSETWAERVEDLLPLGISNLFFFDGEQVRELASSSQATPEVRTAIRTLLGLELPQQLQNDLGLIVTRRRKALVSAPSSKAEMAELEGALRQTERQRGVLGERIAELRNSAESVRRTLDRVRSEFTSGGGELAQKRPELERQLAAVRADQDHARERIRELSSGPLVLGLVRGLLQRSIARAQEEREHLDGKDLGDVLKARDAELIRLLSSAGAVSDVVGAAVQFLEADRVRREQPLAIPAYLNASREAIALASSSLLEAVDRGYPAALEALRQVRHSEQQATRIEAQMRAAAAPEDMEGQLDRLGQVQADAARVDHELAEAQRSYEELAREAVRLTGEMERKLRLHADEEAASEEDSRILRAAERISSVMDEFKRRLLTRKIHELERLVAERFGHLARKKDFISRVLVHPETFELSLFDSDGLPVLRERLSAGEQQLLAVAFLWALALASGRNLPVVIDTPLGRMDHEHRRSLVERYFPHASHQVVLLSTDAEIDERYRSVLADAGAIDREYLLRFDPVARQSEITPGYFWS